MCEVIGMSVWWRSRNGLDLLNNFPSLSAPVLLSLRRCLTLYCPTTASPRYCPKVLHSDDDLIITTSFYHLVRALGGALSYLPGVTSNADTLTAFLEVHFGSQRRCGRTRSTESHALYIGRSRGGHSSTYLFFHVHARHNHGEESHVPIFEVPGAKAVSKIRDKYLRNVRLRAISSVCVLTSILASNHHCNLTAV